MGAFLTTKLKSVFPQAEKEFLKEKNPESSFELLSLGSTMKVWWQCQKCSDHLWLASPNQRTSVGKLRGCPFCSGKKVAKSNSLATTNPTRASRRSIRNNERVTNTTAENKRSFAQIIGSVNKQKYSN